MKKSLDLIISDLKKYWKPLVFTALYFVFAKLLFNQICPSKIFFGLPCPGCGMSRALFLFFTFHPIKAFFMHPLFVFVILLVVVFVVMRYFLFVSVSKLKMPVVVLMISAIILFVIRIILYFPDVEPVVLYKNSILEQLIEIINVDNYSKLK